MQLFLYPKLYLSFISESHPVSLQIWQVSAKSSISTEKYHFPKEIKENGLKD